MFCFVLFCFLFFLVQKYVFVTFVCFSFWLCLSFTGFGFPFWPGCFCLGLVVFCFRVWISVLIGPWFVATKTKSINGRATSATPQFEVSETERNLSCAALQLKIGHHQHDLFP